MRRPLTHTHTLATMDLPTPVWNLIAGMMKQAGYDHVFIEDDGGTIIDMTGIGVRACDNEDVGDG